MIAKAGQIIAIDSVKVDNTLSGDGVRTPLGVKATAPAVSGHAGLSAEKVDNTVYIGMEPEAVKVVSTNESVSIEKTLKSDGTVEYNLGVSVEPVVSDTKIIGSNGISARETAPATYTIGVSGDYVKQEALENYYTKTETYKKEEVEALIPDISNLALSADVDTAINTAVTEVCDWTEQWVDANYVPKDVLAGYYTKNEVDDIVDDYALSADVDTAIAENEAGIKSWASGEFQEKGSYAKTSDITSLSATVNTELDKKADKSQLVDLATKTELNELNAAVAAEFIETSAWTEDIFQKKGKYITSADNSLAGKALVLKDNKWEEAPEGTVYTSGPNIKIDNAVISGRDWTPELSAKANKTDLNGLATETWVTDELVKYYTKTEVDDIVDDYALSADVDTAIAENEASIKSWANSEFQEKGSYAKASDITSLSSTVNTNFQKKGEYITSADNSLDGKALVLKNNKWEEAPAGTTYTEGPNIDIDGTVISGRNWTPELELKADKSQLVDLATKTQLNELNAAVAAEFVETSAWANETFQVAGNYLTPEALNNYYNKTDTDTAIGTAINDISATVVHDYATKTDAEAASANAYDEAKAWVEDQGYLTSVPDSYATKDYVNEASANALNQAETWVGQRGFITKNADDLTYYYKKTETSSTSEISDALTEKVNLPTSQQSGQLVYNATTKVWEAASTPTIPDITANNGLSANGHTVGIDDTNIVANTQYAWTTSGWKQVSIPDTYALKTDVEAASANAYSKAVAEIPSVDNFITKDVNNLTYYYTKSETSSTSEITNALSTKLDSTVAEKTYQTKADMTNYLTTSDASTTYQPIGNYASASDISDMATQTWVGQRGYLTQADLTDYATQTYVDTASAAALSQSKSWVEEQKFTTSADLATKVTIPDSAASALQDKYLVLRTNTDGTVSGWTDFQSQSYSKTEAKGTFLQIGNVVSGDHTGVSGTGSDFKYTYIPMDIVQTAPTEDDGILHIILDS